MGNSWFAKKSLEIQKTNGVAAMLDDRTFCFVIQHGRHAIVFLDLQGLVANQESMRINDQLKEIDEQNFHWLLF